MLEANRRTTKKQSINSFWCNETSSLYMMCVMYFMVDKFEMKNRNLFKAITQMRGKTKK